MLQPKCVVATTSPLCLALLVAAQSTCLLGTDWPWAAPMIMVGALVGAGVMISLGGAGVGVSSSSGAGAAASAAVDDSLGSSTLVPGTLGCAWPLCIVCGAAGCCCERPSLSSLDSGV